jgi:hypothetical protein
MEYKGVGRKPLKIQNLNTPRFHSHTKEEKKEKRRGELSSSLSAHTSEMCGY